jgi:hypothetical protein
MTSPAETPTTTCVSCGAAVSGRFCSECGAALANANCAACQGPLTPGAKFCHHCGTPIGGAPLASQRLETAPRTMTWGVGAIALVAFIALLAGQRFASARTDANTASTADPSVSPMTDRRASAPDISSLSPRERADRLFDRMMRLSSENKTDSLRFFAPMALAVYESLVPLDADLRYDLGRVAEVSGLAPIAQAQADTILRDNPTHLLGLVLGYRAATLRNDPSAQDGYAKRLLAAQPGEGKKNLPEYERHQADILNTVGEIQNRKR